MNILKFLDEKAELYFLMATLVFVTLLIFVQVVLRYIFGTTLTWAEELARYIMLYQIWIGASYAVKADAHLRITSIKDRLSIKNQAKLEVFITILWAIFAIVLAIKSADLTRFLAQQGQVSPAMRVPMAWAYASVPIGLTCMVIRLFQRLYRELKKLEKLEG